MTQLDYVLSFIDEDFKSSEPMSAHLETRCRERQGAQGGGHEETIAERMVRDRVAFLPLPSAPYDACDNHPAAAFDKPSGSGFFRNPQPDIAATAQRFPVVRPVGDPVFRPAWRSAGRHAGAHCSMIIVPIADGPVASQ